jgi:hypothetical protein
MDTHPKAPVVETFISGNGLAVRIGVSKGGLLARIKSAGIVPDGLLIRPGGELSSFLFRTERLPEIRSILNQPKIRLC